MSLIRKDWAKWAKICLKQFGKAKNVYWHIRQRLDAVAETNLFTHI